MSNFNLELDLIIYKFKDYNFYIDYVYNRAKCNMFFLRVIYFIQLFFKLKFLKLISCFIFLFLLNIPLIPFFQDNGNFELTTNIG